MNISLYYKGQTVTHKVDRQDKLRKLYECLLPKFDQHFYQELLLFGNNLRLRLRRTNALINFNDIVGCILKENDIINIEPEERLTSNSQSIHSPKRYDISNIDNSNYTVATQSLDYSQPKKKTTSKPKNLYNVDPRNPISRYQKYDHFTGFSKNSHDFKNPFYRNDLRRSLGADIAPQFETHLYDQEGTKTSSNNYESEASLADMSNLINPSNETKGIQCCKTQSNIAEFEKNKSKSAPASPMKPAPPLRSPHTHMSMLNSFNVRTIGHKINISIIKKPSVGLGFTIVTRDNQMIYDPAVDASNSAIILVNKILPNGGAAESNKLRPGDRLLEINGVSVKSLKEAIEKLRAIPENEEVNLLISRMEVCNTPSKIQEPSLNLPQPSIQQLSYEIPLNQYQKERDQLGLNIICITQDMDTYTMGPGIYIYSILQNSLAAQKSGLRVNDKLIGINGQSVSDCTAEDIIHQLKKVMQNDSMLTITVCRAIHLDKQHNINENKQKEYNYYILPNKMSLDKKVLQSSDSSGNIYNSRFSSTDSVSHKSNNQQPDLECHFVRESKGRRSMSDKRKAHEDASQYTFYQETRLGDGQVNEDRLYSTLPTASRLKKMANNNNQSSYITNKIHGPVKPSQIKQLNSSKGQQEQIINNRNTPNRSISLRNSPIGIKLQYADEPQSPKQCIQTPSYDQPQNFNRALNNSFKRAVQKSLPSNDVLASNKNSIEKIQMTLAESTSIQGEVENSCVTYNPRQVSENISRSNSVKATEDKKKTFNLKKFLTFKPNITRTKSVGAKERCDTLPLHQSVRYQQTSGNFNERNIDFTPGELPVEVHHCADPVIIDSTKRVLEWQMKNDDVISKENMIKEKKLYQTVSGYRTNHNKNMMELDSCARYPVTNTNSYNISGRSCHDSNAYDSTNEYKFSQPRQGHFHNHAHAITISPREDFNSFNNMNTYQMHPPINVSSPNDIYSTGNRVSKKDSKSPKDFPVVSHINKYRF